MFNWFKSQGNIREADTRRYLTFSDDGLLFVRDLDALDIKVKGTALPIDSPEFEELFLQLEDEGFVECLDTGYQLPWASLYNLLDMPGYGHA